MGIFPRWSIRIFASLLSTHTTSLPLSAKQAPATSPTYPVPTTAIFNQSPRQIEMVYDGARPAESGKTGIPPFLTKCRGYHLMEPVQILVDYRPALRARTGVGEYMHEIIRA